MRREVPEYNLSIGTPPNHHIGIRWIEPETEDIIWCLKEQLRVDWVSETPDKDEGAREKESRGELYTLIKGVVLTTGHCNYTYKVA